MLTPPKRTLTFFSMYVAVSRILNISDVTLSRGLKIQECSLHETDTKPENAAQIHNSLKFVTDDGLNIGF